MDKIAEANNEIIMTGLRPKTSDREPAIKILIASAIVVEERLKLDSAGEI